jgi:release factor glutamine methyltransferase
VEINKADMESGKQKTAMEANAAPPTITLLLRKSTDYLKGKGSSTPRLDAELLLAEVLGMERVDLYINFDQPLNPAEIDSYRELIRRRGRGEPVAYILGRTYFRNLKLKVDSSVLLPRPETEHVVEAAIAILLERDSSSAPPRVLDLGTGSGAIALAVAAASPDAIVIAADNSEAALSIAAENASAAALSLRVSFHHSDFFDDLDPVETFDLIISNPPYIAEDEWAGLPVDVRDYEPRQALHGGDDGLDGYRRIITEAHQFLRPGGSLILEIGYQQADAVKQLLAETGRYGEAEVAQDYAGQDRVVTVPRVD